MAELTPAERLQPCLLDRLTDDHPEETKESRDQRIVSLRRYRDAVLRDLDWLLNTGAHSSSEDLTEFTEVARSVLNYGIPDMCGMTASGLKPEDFERRMLEAIRNFEPRILPHTLSLDVRASYGQMDHNAVTFEIRGELWAQPTPDPLYVRTEVDLETGQCELKDRPHG
ncbi:MAG TPA: type VI secretion system baseplate subunit TssE [Phycisphaerae bacterium]|nr:type VI secretion system baseplate subunit TssE [Phycisphaerae bacterium]HUU22573.1 type VI secretion system baseplate subunit TssE [Phycisphaerae bacterium]